MLNTPTPFLTDSGVLGGSIDLLGAGVGANPSNPGSVLNLESVPPLLAELQQLGYEKAELDTLAQQVDAGSLSPQQLGAMVFAAQLNALQQKPQEPSTGQIEYAASLKVEVQVSPGAQAVSPMGFADTEVATQPPQAPKAARVDVVKRFQAAAVLHPDVRNLYLPQAHPSDVAQIEGVKMADAVQSAVPVEKHLTPESPEVVEQPLASNPADLIPSSIPPVIIANNPTSSQESEALPLQVPLVQANRPDAATDSYSLSFVASKAEPNVSPRYVLAQTPVMPTKPAQSGLMLETLASPALDTATEPVVQSGANVLPVNEGAKAQAESEVPGMPKVVDDSQVTMGSQVSQGTKESQGSPALSVSLSSASELPSSRTPERPNKADPKLAPVERVGTSVLESPVVEAPKPLEQSVKSVLPKQPRLMVGQRDVSADGALSDLQSTGGSTRPATSHTQLPKIVFDQAQVQTDAEVPAMGALQWIRQSKAFTSQLQQAAPIDNSNNSRLSPLTLTEPISTQASVADVWVDSGAGLPSTESFGQSFTGTSSASRSEGSTPANAGPSQHLMDTVKEALKTIETRLPGRVEVGFNLKDGDRVSMQITTQGNMMEVAMEGLSQSMLDSLSESGGQLSKMLETVGYQVSSLKLNGESFLSSNSGSQHNGAEAGGQAFQSNEKGGGQASGGNSGQGRHASGALKDGDSQGVVQQVEPTEQGPNAGLVSVYV